MRTLASFFFFFLKMFVFVSEYCFIKKAKEKQGSEEGQQNIAKDQGWSTAQAKAVSTQY